MRRISGKHVSVYAPMGGETEDSMTMLDTLFDSSDGEKPDSNLMDESLKREVKSGLSKLTEKEIQVLTAYYGLDGNQPMTLEEIGHICSLTRERVRQIKERAIRRLRKSINRNDLRSYLG